MTNRKSLFQHASVNTHSIFVVAAVGMILTSIYLTQHYFQVHFPVALSGGSLCDINSFFNCDGTTLSPASNIFGVPISVLGIMTGVIFLLGYMFKDEGSEGTIYTLAAVNMAGCIILFLYSLIALGSLCPFCSLYYLFSIVAFVILFKRSNIKTIDPKYAAIFAVAYIIPAVISLSVVKGKESDIASLKQSLQTQFETAPKLAEPQPASPFIINKVENAPVQINIFSDFQCPACKALSSLMHDLVKRYKDHVNINYYFYPLDNECNPAITRPFHTLACKAAYVAACAPEKFGEVHDHIFNNQDKLSVAWINDYAKKLGVAECAAKIETKHTVQGIINQSKPFNIQSTPTILINGVKIEGILPPNQMYILMDNLIKK